MEQDVKGFAEVLPRLPQDIELIYLRSPHEAIKEKSFLVRPLKVMEALRYCTNTILPSCLRASICQLIVVS